MADTWYCPQCGPTGKAQVNVDYTISPSRVYAHCLNCPNEVSDKIPPFVTALQQQIAELESKLKGHALDNPKIFCAMLSTGVCDLPEKVAALEQHNALLKKVDDRARNALIVAWALAHISPCSVVAFEEARKRYEREIKDPTREARAAGKLGE